MAGIYVEIIGNATQFKKELDSAVASTAKANNGFKKMGRAAGIAGLAIAGGLAIGIEKSVKAAMHMETANALLDTSFKNAGLSAAAYADQVKEAEAAGRKLGFTDEATATNLASLITATGNYKEALRDNAIAMDVSAKKGVDLSTAGKLVLSTLSGNIRSAKALGFVLLPVTSNMDALRAKYKALGEAIPAAEARTARFADKQATAAEALQKVTDRLHGTAQAASETSAGGISVLGAQFDHLKVSLGEHLIPALKTLVERLAEFVDFLNKHTTVVTVFAVALGVLAGALLAVAAAAAIADLAMSPFLLPIAAAVVAIGALSFIAYKLVTDFKNSWPLLLPIVLGPLGAIIAAVIHWHSQITGAFAAAWAAVKSLTSAGINAVLGLIRGAIGAATSAASAVGHAIVNGLRAGLSAIAGAVTGALGKIWGALKGAVGTALSAGSAIGSAIIHGVASGITGAVGGAIKAVAGAVGSIFNAAKHAAHIGSPSRLFADGVGKPIVQGIALGIKEGTPQLIAQMGGLAKSMVGAFGFKPGDPYVNPMQGAKTAFDHWAKDTAVDNFTGVGQSLARALSDGFTGVGHGDPVSLLGKGIIPFSGAGLGSGAGNPQLGTQIGIGGSNPTAGGDSVIHNVVTLDGKVLYESWKKQAGRDVVRNGGTGVRS